MNDATITPLAEAVQALGGQANAASVVGCTQQYMSDVLRGVRRKGIPPAEWCLPLEEATRRIGKPVPAAKLRPDIFKSEAA